MLETDTQIADRREFRSTNDCKNTMTTLITILSTQSYYKNFFELLLHVLLLTATDTSHPVIISR